MKKDLRAERKGLLLSFLSLALIGALFALPSQFRSAANVGDQENAGRQSPVSEIENYDIRKDKSDSGVNALAEFRAASGKPESAAAEVQEKVKASEKALRERFPGLEIKYNEALKTAEIIAPRSGMKRAAMLTAPSTGKRPDVLRSFVKANNDLLALSDSQIDNLKVKADYKNPMDDLSFVNFEQEVNGIPVFQAELKAAFTKSGEIIRVVNNLAPGLEYSSLASEFGAPDDAVRAAFQHISRQIKTEALSKNESASTDLRTVYGNWATSAEKIYFPTEAGVARAAWLVGISDADVACYVVVDAETGTMLWRKNLYDHQTQPVSYNVYADNSSNANLLKALDSPAPLSPGPNNPGTGMQGLPANRMNLTLVGNEPPYTFNQKGWITDNTNATEGNNVRAGLDRVAPDGIDEVVTGLPDRIFTTASPAWNPPPGNPGPGDDPLSFQAQRGAVIQMFYIANRFHDEMYLLGFNEPARNFQHENFSGQGAGGDRVLTEAQDYAGTNNARFATYSDGNPSSKMEMFLWTGPNPDYDGAADAEIVVHELAHGVSNRLHNNAFGLQSQMSKGMGEGWSDFYALTMLAEPSNPINGTYALAGYSTYLRTPGFSGNYYYGIRRFPKAVMSFRGGPGNRPHNGLTFKHLNANCVDVINTISAYARGPVGNTTQCDDVHNAGEIWSSALWEVRAKFIQQYGFKQGTELVLRYVTNGMKMDPINPTMIDARNSILLAAATSANPDLDTSLIWQGFAARGMGFSASVQSTNIPTLVTEAFDLPNVVLTNDYSFADNGDGDGFAEPGETIVLTVPVVNNTNNLITGVTVNVNGGASVSFGNVVPGATVTRTINYTIPANLACGSDFALNLNINSSLGTRVETRTLKLGAPNFGLVQNFDAVAAPALPAGWTQVSIGGNLAGWKTTNTTSDSAPNSVFAPTMPSAGGADLLSPVFTLNSNNAILNFRHKFNTEEEFDGGLLEISISGGAFQEITKAGGTFITGGYNGTIRSNASGTQLAGASVWHGDSRDIAGNTNGYITTSIQLPASANGVAVQFKWRIGHDSSESVEGWYIDNVRVVFNYTCNIVEPPPPPTNTARADFDGDGRTDRTVFRSGAWHQFLSQTNQPKTVDWGIPTDVPVSGDFDGDRKADPAVFRSGAWYVFQSSSNTMYAVNWGAPGDIPVPGDYNGDGKDDAAIFRNGLWAIYPTGGGAPIYQSWGVPGDKPVAGKYDNDTKTDLAVFRAGNWYILKSSSNTYQAISWGFASDTLVPGDYNGDGLDETAVFRNGAWYILSLTGEFTSHGWGVPGDIPVPGDYDGDKKLDPAVFRNGAWYILASTAGFSGSGWGQPGDTPIPSNYTK